MRIKGTAKCGARKRDHAALTLHKLFHRQHDCALYDADCTDYRDPIQGAYKYVLIKKI